jgi:hypothetical protein
MNVRLTFAVVLALQLVPLAIMHTRVEPRFGPYALGATGSGVTTSNPRAWLSAFDCQAQRSKTIADGYFATAYRRPTADAAERLMCVHASRQNEFPPIKSASIE